MGSLRKRRIGLLYATEVDGLTYFPLSGSASSGYSIKAGREMNTFHRILYAIQEYLDQNGNEIKKQIESATGKQLVAIDFSVKLRDGMFYIYEKNSGCYLYSS